jgi:hypothetical protein
MVNTCNKVQIQDLYSSTLITVNYHLSEKFMLIGNDECNHLIIQQFNYIKHKPLGYRLCFNCITYKVHLEPVVSIKIHVGCSCIKLPPKHVFFIFHKFPCSLEIPIRKEDTTEIFIMLATDVLTKEFLSNGDSTIDTYLWKWNTSISVDLIRYNIA